MPRPLHLGLNKESDTFLEFGKSQFTRSMYLTLSFETLSSISDEMIQSFSLNEPSQLPASCSEILERVQIKGDVSCIVPTTNTLACLYIHKAGIWKLVSRNGKATIILLLNLLHHTGSQLVR